MSSYFTVSRDDGVYECFPDLVLLRSGGLLCTYRESDSHVGRRYSRIVLREGLDRGRRWPDELKRVVVEGPRSEDDDDPQYERWNCPRICQLRDGRVALICDLSNEWSAGARESRVFVWWSEDDGNTWTGPQETGITGIVPDKICELSDGSLLLGTHPPRNSPSCGRQNVWRSKDGGKTWSGPVLVAERQGLWLCEGSILEVPGGTVVCYMRENSGRGDPAYKAFSSDGGLTWEGPYETLLFGCHRPVTGILQSGGVLTTYRYLSAARVAENFAATIEPLESVLEKDPAKQSARTLMLDHDNSPHPDCGYSGWVQFEDGEIFVAYYIKRDAPRAYIRAALFPEADISP